MSPLILIAEPENFSADARARLDALGTVEAAGTLDRAGLLARVGGADVLMVRLGNLIDAEVLAAAPRLKAIVSPTTGLDHIDVEAARARGVAVLSLRGETAFLRTVTATAELTWGLLLAVLRGIPGAAASVRDGDWDRDRFRGQEVRGKRLGIVGLGRLGSMVARYGAAFAMPVAAYDPFLAPEDWPPEVERLDSLRALAARSDVLSLHAPLTEDTRGLLTAADIAALPKGAVVLNTARGALADEAALASALDSGHLAGAGLDVLADETTGGALSSPLVALARRHPGVIITPHIGGATVTSMARTEVFMADKLAEFLGETHP